MSGIH